MIATSPTREGLWVWGASVLCMAALGGLGRLVPWVDSNLGGLVAVMFLYLPTVVIFRRGEDLPDYGLGGRPVGRDLAVFALLVAVVFPVYLLGHWAFHTKVLGRSLEVGPDTFRRFDRDLEGHPEQRDGRVAVSVEGDWLRVLPGNAPAMVSVTTVPPDAPMWRPGGRRLRLSDGVPTGAAVSRSGEPGTTPARNDLAAPGSVEVSPAAGGLLVDLRGREELRVNSAAPVALGAYGVGAEPPVESSRSGLWWLWLFAIQALMVALPEEWFYRGYLQHRLELGRPKRRILGAELGTGWLLSSALFALGHLVLDPRPVRLLVFFPSLLFGWIRARTDSVVPGALFHAACNVLATAVNYAYVGPTP